jgi:hypothetical protein
MKNHPLTPADKTISGTFKKTAKGLAIRFGGHKESRKTPLVIISEARPEKTMGLTDLRIFADARRDKIAVTAR